MRVPPDLERCIFTTRNNLRCRGWRTTPDDPRCYYHSRQHRLKTEPAAAAAAGEAILGRLAGLKSARAINQLLHRILLAVAEGRATPHQGNSLAAVARLLLQSLHEVRVEEKLLQERRRAHQRGELVFGEKVLLSPAELYAVNCIRDLQEQARFQPKESRSSAHSNSDPEPAPPSTPVSESAPHSGSAAASAPALSPLDFSGDHPSHPETRK